MGLGDRVKELRTQRGLTQQQMSEKLGMGRANYSHIENDRVTATSEDLEKIADILVTSTDYLLGRSDDPSVVQTETPADIKTWLRAGNADLTETEKDELGDDLEDYFRMRKERIIRERKNK
jgi:transcriptional regulator with XRE-family HTH domain